ncbi:hypothetical protein GCK72_010100 [Caenorhabditis remanei]|uniref:Uncharacterized protein n=1 Tax=Caenorhabditis remanei TaxID=31234 RepID=A0A6A5H4E6_CAERE|nr:hypothetical protein GCK72_010100 [Caenorhabditis remanei]KAF1761841.1 hypothetical protein GCK72_010100 [Caenorhabditis remanei]
MENSPENIKHDMPVGSEEDVEDELASPNLYEESMAEITLNETRGEGPGGHDSDPFDRSGEYDEDVNLEAPPPITPDIPEISTEVLVSLRNRVANSEASSIDIRNPFDDSDQNKKTESSPSS